MSRYLKYATAYFKVTRFAMELSAERRVKAFEVIKGFVILARGILKVSKATALWDRLLKKNDIVSEKIVTKSIKAFTRFCTQYGANIRSERLEFPKETKIQYSEIIFIDVNALLKYSDDDDKAAVKEYFLTLSALLTKDEESLSLLNTIKELRSDEEQNAPGGNAVFQNFDSKTLGIDTSTPAGEFFGGILDKVGNVFKDGGDMSNPMTAITKLMSSGLMTDVTQGASSKINKGELNVADIFGCLQQVVQKIATTTTTTTTTTSKPVDEESEEKSEEEGETSAKAKSDEEESDEGESGADGEDESGEEEEVD